jgi:hypothetical protein
VKKILKRILYVILGILVFLLLLAGVTQTQFFRDRLRAVVVSNLDSLLTADVALGEFTGNLVTGFSIDGISLTVGDHDLLVADRLDVRYDLFQIPGNTISIDRFTLVKPRFALIRGRDGRWNFERMIRPTSDDTSVAAPLTWVVLLNRLEIQDGAVRLVDSAALAEPDHERDGPYYVEYHDVTLTGFQLVTSLAITKDEKRAEIENLSFHSVTPEITLKRFSGLFSVRKDGAVVKNMVLQTGRSDLALHAEMEGVDVFGGIDLEQLKSNPVALSLTAGRLDLNELKRFIPELEFLNSTVALNLQVEGEFGELKMKKLELVSGRTDLSIAGTVYNLHTPDRLFLDVKFTESKLYGPDARTILPSFNLPDFARLGVTTLNLEYLGAPLDFQTKFLLETSAGSLHADASMVIGGPATLKYKGEVQAMSVDLARVFDDPAIVSNIRATAHIEGEGISFDHLRTTLKLQIDSSLIAGRRVTLSQLLVEAAERKMNTTGFVEAGAMRTVVTGVLDEQQPDRPAFSFTATISSLNLNDLLLDREHASDLTMEIAASGTGLSWDDLNADFRIDFSPSRYRDYQITDSRFHLLVDQRDPLQKQWKLESSVADFSLSGAFDTEYMANLISFELGNLRGAIGEKFASLDSSIAASVNRRALGELGRDLARADKKLNASFLLRLKDLEPISSVTGNRIFNGVGLLQGSLEGNYDELAVRAELKVADFFYGNADSGLLIQNGVASLSVNSLRPVQPLKDLEVRLVADAERMHVNRSELDSLRVTFTYQQEYSSYTGRAQFNRDTRTIVSGFSSIAEDQVVFTFNDFQLAYKDFAWRADGGASVGFGIRGIDIKGLVMRRDTQSVTLLCHIGAADELSATVTAHAVDLENLKYLMTKQEGGAKRNAFAGIGTLSLHAGGTLDNPAYTASLQAGNVSFRGIPFGEIVGEFSYAREMLDIDLYIEEKTPGVQGRPLLTMKGRLPVNLAVKGANGSSDQPMNLTIHSDGIPINILDPLLPTFDQLNGTMRCDVTLVGSPGSPDYRGTISLEGCSFLFVPNLVSYTFDGTFQPEGNRIRVLDAVVRSKPSDDIRKREGVVHLTGDFAFKDFTPGDFNLTAKGKLLVVKETTRGSSLSVYGNLFLEIGPQGLRYTGAIDNSRLRGYVLITNSSLIFPPTQETVGREEQSSTVPVVVLDDTSQVKTQPVSAISARYFGADAEGNGNEKTNKNGVPTKSFVDGIRYDLDIEAAGGNTEFRMIFNAATNEELVAKLVGRFSITGDGTRWIGNLTIDRAYYNFIKRFDAEGTIRYSGDFLNPELNITARYEGLRTPADTSGARPEKVIVTMNITGTKSEPKLAWSMTIDDVDYYAYRGATSNDVQTDAVAFILAGTFPLSRSEANDAAARLDLGPAAQGALFTGASSLFTNALSEYLRRETGFIQSVEFRYGTEGEGFGDRADIRLSGVAAGGLWRYGGRLFSGSLGDADVSILYSLGDILDRSSLKNFMFEFERRVESNKYGNVDDKKETNSARVFYRFSF